jgi:hypothetical protein
MQTRDTVVAIFDERDDAHDAINDLKNAGFRGDDISLVARQSDEAGKMAEETGTRAGEGATTGALAGGILGGLGGFLAGVGALAIPVFGPVIAAGAFATALTGAAVGAGVGAIAGALIGMGIPKEEADWYEERVKGGAWLVSVRSGGRYEEARRILHDNGGKDYETGRSTTTYRSWDQASPEFRSDYERQYGSSSRWSDVEPAHRYGYEAYGRSQGTGQGSGTYRTWTETEPELRRDWESRNQGSWDEARSHVRHGYDYGRGRRRFHDDDDTAGTAGGAVAGGAAGAVIGGAVAGPPGAVAGAAIGGVGGAAAGNKAEDAMEDDDVPTRRERR